MTVRRIRKKLLFLLACSLIAIYIIGFPSQLNENKNLQLDAEHDFDFYKVKVQHRRLKNARKKREGTLLLCRMAAPVLRSWVIFSTTILPCFICMNRYKQLNELWEKKV